MKDIQIATEWWSLNWENPSFRAAANNSVQRKLIRSESNSRNKSPHWKKIIPIYNELNTSVVVTFWKKKITSENSHFKHFTKCSRPNEFQNNSTIIICNNCIHLLIQLVFAQQYTTSSSNIKVKPNKMFKPNQTKCSSPIFFLFLSKNQISVKDQSFQNTQNWNLEGLLQFSY